MYMSFGGEIDISTAPQELQDIFINVFAQQKIRFLWKRNGERPTHLSKNVLMKNWMPQRDILGNTSPGYMP